MKVTLVSLFAFGVFAGSAAFAHDQNKHDGKMGMPMAAQMKEMMDTNKDGVISKEEFMRAHEAMFDRMDTNHDGRLDAEEQKAAHEKMRSMREHMMGKSQKNDMKDSH